MHLRKVEQLAEILEPKECWTLGNDFKLLLGCQSQIQS